MGRIEIDMDAALLDLTSSLFDIETWRDCTVAWTFPQSRTGSLLHW